MSARRVRLEWPTADGVFVAIEPTAAEIAAAAPALAVAYSDPHNAPLMGHEHAMSAADVIEHYADMEAEGARQFHFYLRGAPAGGAGPAGSAGGAGSAGAAGAELVGDGDLRGLEPAPPGDPDAGGTCELAIMIAARAAQGRGLGTRFAILLHAFAFRGLGLARVYVAIVPANVGSQRLFAKLGYAPDDSPAARAYADVDSDLTFSIDRATFERRHADALGAITVTPRADG